MNEQLMLVGQSTRTVHGVQYVCAVLRTPCHTVTALDVSGHVLQMTTVASLVSLALAATHILLR